MKRLALFLAALGVVGSGAFGVATAQAYQPVDEEVLFADPFRNAPGAPFDAVVTGCFPGEDVVFTNFGITPNQVETVACDLVTFEARVTFQAPEVLGVHQITAFLAAEESTNPDIPDRPERLLQAQYVVSNGGGGGGSGGGTLGGGATVISTGGSGDIWPSFLSAAGIYRTFLALLALVLGIFFVLLWRRRKEEEESSATYASGAMPPLDTNNPSLA